MNITQYKNEFDSLFENDSSSEIQHYAKRGYWIPNEIKENGILYIGLNPSYPHNDYDENGRQFFNLERHEPSYYKQFREFDKYLRENEISISWSHFDMLILRETKQSVISKWKKTKDGEDFLLKNLEVTKKILEASFPKIIVVSNTLSKELLIGKNWCNYDIEWDDIIGTYRFKGATSLSGIPVFFSSMLTGQRALDIGSRERLRWQIKNSLK